jgi:transketolase
MSTWRPCDAVETAVAWKCAVEKKSGPSCLIFSRQGLPHQVRSDDQLSLISRGGYVLQDCDGTPDAIIIGTGSEVALAVDAAKQLTEEGKKIRVVSMPCTEAFDEQDQEYKDSVLPPSVTARVAVEAGVTDFWYKYVGTGRVIGIDRFGESAPANELFPHFGFTVENVVGAVKGVM